MPKDPLKFYKRLADVCLDYDPREANDQSKATKKILAEVCLRWKISNTEKFALSPA
jgi:hypothetical protein